MSDLDALLAGIVADPHNGLRWLIVADWLDDHGQPERAELLRLHRELLRTCTEPDAHPERAEWHARIVELMRAGATPCIPRHILTLPGGVELVGHFIPPGSFRMGSPETEEERNDDEELHPVTLTRGFFVGVYPVTQTQYRALMDVRYSYVKSHSHPVGTASWDDAVSFCERLSAFTGAAGRLPTEAEWEYFCRAGTTTPFHWGDESNGTQANCFGGYPYGTKEISPDLFGQTDVGTFATEWPHPWGLTDCHGNVWEWCADWYDREFYDLSPVEDPECRYGPQRRRVSRGGSCSDSVQFCRSANRTRLGTPYGMSTCGFRVVFTLD